MPYGNAIWHSHEAMLYGYAAAAARPRPRPVSSFVRQTFPKILPLTNDMYFFKLMFLKSLCGGAFVVSEQSRHGFQFV